MTHFYLTLPSNSSEQYYPDNTLTRFTTRLHSTLELEGSWEVGLSEIIFPSSWITLDKKACKFSVMCEQFPYLNYEFMPEDLLEKLYIPQGHYESVEKIVEAINNEIDTTFEKIPKPDNNPRVDDYHGNFYTHGVHTRVLVGEFPKLKYDKLKQKVRFTISRLTGIAFSPVLANVLGLSSSQNPLFNDDEYEDVMKIFGERACDLTAGINSLYVYCDVIEHVPVGDTKVPLLRIVDAKGPAHEIIHTIYENPRYIPLQKKNFDSIEIDIRDCFGEKISFESGQVVVVLDFQRARNPYFL